MRSLRFTAAILSIPLLGSFMLGCGSSGGGGTGPVATTTTMSVPASPGTKVSSGSTIAFAISVNASVGANGQVQLFDGSTPIGMAAAVTNGSTTINSPALTAVGTHSISAHYLGDTKTLASQSGVLFITVIGTTPPVPITATSGSVTASANITITVN